MADIQPHGEWVEVCPELWLITGSMARSPLPRNMAVYRLPGGGLLLHSVIALNPQGMAQLEAIGTPQVMIVPNGFHRSDALFYKERYPALQVVCPAAARERVEQVVQVDDTCEALLPTLGIGCHPPQGVKPSELVYELSVERGCVLVFTDLLFNLPRLSGFSGWIVHLIGSSGFFGMTRVGRILGLKDRKLFAGWLRQLAELDGLTAILVAHGGPVTSDCRSRLRAAADRLDSKADDE